MSSYYPSFSYLGVNSRDKGLIVSHFDADSGESDTFLGMEPIYTDSADGSRRLDYGARYSNVAVFRITVIKEDGGDFSVKEVRDNLRWLTGAKTNSSLDLFENFVENFIGDGIAASFELVNTCDHIARVYVGGVVLDNSKWTYDRTSKSIQLTDTPINGTSIKVAYGRIKYSFICRTTNAWQYKMDARTTGLVVEFTSVSPWAYSAKQVVSTLVNGSKTLTINNASDDLYGYTPVNVTFEGSTQVSGVNLLRETGWYTDVAPTSAGWIYTSGAFIEFPYDTLPDRDDFYDNGFIHWTGSKAGDCNTPRLNVKAGEVYTLSFRHRGAGLTVFIVGRNAADDKQTWGPSKSFGNASTKDCSFTFTIPSDRDVSAIYAVFRTTAGQAGVLGRIKLERGDKATLWSPHPEDSKSAGSLKITNKTTQDVTNVTNIVANEIISISDNMMITSDKPNKIFGNTFNFIFPRLVAGENQFDIRCTGRVTFEYVYAIKIGDCAMDITVISDPICNDDGEIILDMLPFSRISDLPNNFQAYNIQNVYSKADVDALVAGIEIDEVELNAMLIEELN